MAQQLPRYQRPASLIQSPDVTGTNISALVQAEAQKTQAITSALDKLIGYAIDVGEKKEKEQKELLELEAISEFPTYSYEIDNHISDLTVQVQNACTEIISDRDIVWFEMGFYDTQGTIDDNTLIIDHTYSYNFDYMEYGQKHLDRFLTIGQSPAFKLWVEEVDTKN